MSRRCVRRTTRGWGRGSLTITTNPARWTRSRRLAREELPARGPANPGDDDDSPLGEVQEEGADGGGPATQRGGDGGQRGVADAGDGGELARAGQAQHTATREERQQLGEREGRGGFSLRSLAQAVLAGTSATIRRR